MDRASAASAIAALFEDGGASILAEGGGQTGWEAALEPMPEALYKVKSATPGVTMLTLARDLWSQADHIQMASAVTRGLLAYHQENQGEHHPDSYAELGALGALARRAGSVDNASRLLETAYNGLRSGVGGRDLRLAIVAGNYGLHLAQQGDFKKAEVVLHQAYKIRKRQQPDQIANVAGQLGEVRIRLGMYEEGVSVLKEAWMGHLDRHGEKHPKTLAAALGLAKTLNAMEKFRESAPVWRDLHAVAVASGHEERIAEMGFNLGLALYRSLRTEEGIRRIDEVVRWTRAASEGGTPHPELAERLTVHAELQIDGGRTYEADGLLREAAAAEARTSGEGSVQTADRYVTLGNFLVASSQVQEGLGYLESASMVLEAELGAEHPRAQYALAAAARGFAAGITECVDRGDTSMASEFYRHAMALVGPGLGYDHPDVLVLKQRATLNRLKV